MNRTLRHSVLAPSRRAAACALFAGLALTGCASSKAERTPQPAKQGGPAEQATDERAQDNRKAEVLHRKIEIGQLELAALVDRNEAAVAAARVELALAEGELATFRDLGRPTRLGLAELDLRGTRDRAQEAADELAQIELMYKDQDLDDVTAEFVVARGRRSAERAAQRIQLEEQNLIALRERTLPAEETKLALDVERARGALEAAEHSATIERRNKGLELDELRYELEQLEAKLAKQSREGKRS
ncbi:MAG: hypothetical protein R3F49_16225 [Planctomycetota bacterium]